MRTKLFILLICVSLVLSVTACSGVGEYTSGKSANQGIIFNSDNSNEERNLLLTEDIKIFKKELPKRHKNLFHTINKEEFNNSIDKLIENIDQLSNQQVFVELKKIVASVEDAHTNINIWDGYSYPLQFYLFDGNIYVVNADTSLEEMMYTRILKIDGVDISIVMEQLKSLISHENESWVLAMLPNYLQSPIYMYGLGIIQNESEAVFTVEKDGEMQDFTVAALEDGESADFLNKETKDVLIGKYDKYYEYQYLSAHKALYFEYNVCADMDRQRFTDFNKEMFDVIEDNEVNKIIIDLRNNSGGNSEILNHFTKRLKKYIAKNPGVKVSILVGRYTFSSGMFAIYRIKEAAPEAISIGEPTGGALDCYGDVKSMNLPNSQMTISYSTKYFKFSRDFSYKNKGIGTFWPDYSVKPTMEDYKSGTDAALDYALGK